MTCLRPQRFVPYLVVAASVALLALTMTGCVHSDTLTEKVYDNNPESVVDTTVPPALVNSATATQTSEALPRLETVEDTQSEHEKEQDMPVYDGDYDSDLTEKRAAQAQASAAAERAGKASKKASGDSESSTETGTDDSEPDDDSATEADDPTEGDDEDRVDEETPNDNSDVTADDEVDEGDVEANKDKEEGKKKSGGTGSTYTTDPDADEPEIPEGIDEVAAVGNAAVIAAMIGGEANALVACDEDTKAKTADVLAARGMGNAIALWRGDGTKAGSLSQENFDKLVTETVPDLVFVTEGDNTLSSAQKEALQEADIDVYTLPELTSATRIRTAVKIVGQVLAEGGVEGAEDAYKGYLEFHDKLLEKCVKANGGMTGGFDFDSGKSADAASEVVATLVVDKWDAQARYKDSNGVLETPDGIAVATLGYDNSPANYYLSAGGVLNNAASSTIRAQETSKAGIVWQFNTTQMPFGFGRWSGLDEATFDLSSKITGGAFVSDLLQYRQTRASLGTSGFPALVAATQELAERIRNNADDEGEAYYPYPTINPAGTGNTVGYYYDPSATKGGYAESCIGDNNKGASVLDGSMFDIYVNPKGLCQEDSDDELCSWIAGSLESVLEASWAYWRFRDGNEADFEKDVKDFYATFYGYELSGSELDKIVAGVKE